jgi:anhydro-N-acetylmuramic acid kinase
LIIRYRPYPNNFYNWVMQDKGTLYRAIGMMSGTSMDGIDVAVLDTDGDSLIRLGEWATEAYPPVLRQALLGLTADGADLARFELLELEVTRLHIDFVTQFCGRHGIDLGSVDCIGFHGQTIKHEPDLGRCRQLGDGAQMAQALGRTVINRFRDNDLRHGGQGAPFAPAYHRALARSKGLREPLVILNIGGVSNVTLIDSDRLEAFDCGPGNALIDDWVRAHCNVPYDEDGRISASGRVDEPALAALMSDPYFRIPGAKSLDRNNFSAAPVQHLSAEDGAATLVAFTAQAIAKAAEALPARAPEWIIVGGGRLNKTLVSTLRKRLAAPVRIAEDLQWAGDAIEAQAFAYLAVRSLRGLPLSWPSTTGVRQPVTGGVRHEPVDLHRTG